MLIVDIGGGTSDFSIVRVSPQRSGLAQRKDDILANGGVHIGGTDFDRVLSLARVMPHLGFGRRRRTVSAICRCIISTDLATSAQHQQPVSQRRVDGIARGPL